MHLRYLAAIFALVLFATPSRAVGPTYTIDAHILSTGTSVRALSSCYRLDAVIAEPAAGFSSGGAYDLSTGFSYNAALPNDNLFGNSFEDCSQ
jgi:hypothetical protein